MLNCTTHYSLDQFPFIKNLGLYIQDNENLNNDFVSHTHSFNEVFIVFSGHAVHLFNGKEYELSAGDIFCIKGNTPHGFIHVNNMHLCNLMYLPRVFTNDSSSLIDNRVFSSFVASSAFQEYTVESAQIRIPIEELRFLEELTQSTALLISKGNPILYPTINYAFKSLFAYISSFKIESQQMVDNHQIIADSLLFIKENIDKKINVSDIAKYVHLSSRQLERLFKAETDMSPVQYMIELKMKTALIMILERKMSVNEIGHSVGFNDPSYFSRVFRDFFGFTPLQAKNLLNHSVSC